MRFAKIWLNKMVRPRLELPHQESIREKYSVSRTWQNKAISRVQPQRRSHFQRSSKLTNLRKLQIQEKKSASLKTLQNMDLISTRPTETRWKKFMIRNQINTTPNLTFQELSMRTEAIENISQSAYLIMIHSEIPQMRSLTKLQWNWTKWHWKWTKLQ